MIEAGLMEFYSRSDGDNWVSSECMAAVYSAWSERALETCGNPLQSPRERHGARNYGDTLHITRLRWHAIDSGRERREAEAFGATARKAVDAVTAGRRARQVIRSRRMARCWQSLP